MQNGDEGKLDRVRELLYGAHAREQQDRLTSIQTTLRDETERLEQEMRDRLASIEERLNSEIRDLNSRLERESKAREESLAAQRRDVGETLAAIDAKLVQLERHDAKLGDKIDETRSLLERELEERVAALDRASQERLERIRDAVEQVESRQNRRLDSVAGELRDGKVDRTALSALLNELALAVSGVSDTDGA